MKSSFWSRGDFFIWLTGATLAFSLIMVAGLLLIVVYNGLGFFWPNQVALYTLNDGTAIQGEAIETEKIPRPDQPEAPKEMRTKVKRGNRDLYGMDFIWIPNDTVKKREYRPNATVFERLEWGNFYGNVKEIKENGKVIAAGPKEGWNAFN